MKPVFLYTVSLQKKNKPFTEWDHIYLCISILVIEITMLMLCSQKLQKAIFCNSMIGEE